MYLFFAVLVACTALEAAEAAKTDFRSPVYVNLSAAFDFSKSSSANQKNSLLLKIVTTYTKRTRSHRVVMHYQDLCFSDERGEWDSYPHSWEELHDKVSKMVSDMLESGTPEGTEMFRMSDKEWLDLPQEEQEKCNKTRIFVLRKKKNPDETSEAKKRKQLIQEENSTASTHRSGLVLPGCVMDKNCTQKCFSTSSSPYNCSKLEVDCSLKCKKSAINFDLNSSSKIILRKQPAVRVTKPPSTLSVTPKTKAKKSKKTKKRERKD